MKICKLCKKEVNDEEYNLFSGMHSKCENEINDCREVQDENIN